MTIDNVGRESRDEWAVRPNFTVSEDRLPELFESRTHPAGLPRRCFERLGCEATRGLAIGKVGRESRDGSAVKPAVIVSEDRGWPRRRFGRLGCGATRGMLIGMAMWGPCRWEGFAGSTTLCICIS